MVEVVPCVQVRHIRHGDITSPHGWCCCRRRSRRLGVCHGVRDPVFLFPKNPAAEMRLSPLARQQALVPALLGAFGFHVQTKTIKHTTHTHTTRRNVLREQRACVCVLWRERIHTRSVFSFWTGLLLPHQHKNIGKVRKSRVGFLVARRGGGAPTQYQPGAVLRLACCST